MTTTNQVTVKATQTHIVEAGKIVRVERTALIDAMIDKGQFEVVPDSEGPAPEVDLSPAITPELVVPARNAPTAEWAEFVGTRVATADRPLTGDESRSELIELWDQFSTGVQPTEPGGVPVAPDGQLVDSIANDSGDVSPA